VVWCSGSFIHLSKKVLIIENSSLSNVAKEFFIYLVKIK